MGLYAPLSSNIVLNSESIIVFRKMTDHLPGEEKEGTFIIGENVRVLDSQYTEFYVAVLPCMKYQLNVGGDFFPLWSPKHSTCTSDDFNSISYLSHFL